MVRIFIERTQSFGIHDDHLYWVAVGRLPIEWFGPHPNTLGTRINGRSNTKTIAAIQQHSVQQVAFASSIHAGHCYYADWSFQILKELPSVFVDLEH